MSKTIKRLSLVLMLLISLIPNSIYAEEQPIKIWINGNYVNSDVSPIIENNRTLVPIRVVSENLGYNVIYYPENKSIHIAYLEIVNDVETKDDSIFNTFHMTIDNPIINVDNPKNATSSTKILDVAPKIINNRTFVPIRFLAEEMGLNIDWGSENLTVVIGSGYNK